MRSLQLKSGADWFMLQKRSQLLQQLRAFFYERNLIEVDSPILSPYATLDAHLDSVQVQLHLPGRVGVHKLYAHTSPEYALKRLLAQGAGDLFYLGKAFRDGDLSPRHQPEFTLLEWYRLGFCLQDLIEETFALCRRVLRQDLLAEVITYRQLFADYLGIDNIHQASAEICVEVYQQKGLPEVAGVSPTDKVLWEQLLFTEIIEPHLGQTPQGQAQITAVVGFPSHISSLAQVDPDNPEVVQRVEIYIEGMELANGYFELQQAEDYQAVFEMEQAKRKQLLKSPAPIDQALLAALKKRPLPPMSGIALGVDRLLMLQQGAKDIRQVLPFYLC